MLGNVELGALAIGLDPVTGRQATDCLGLVASVTLAPCRWLPVSVAAVISSPQVNTLRCGCNVCTALEFGFE